MKKIILASTSPYRRTLMEKLGIAFTTLAPDCDETPLSDEAPAALVKRLAKTKAKSLREAAPDALIIGSDQVAELHGSVLGKSGSHAVAKEQLSFCSGNTVVFHTGLCLFDISNNHCQVDVIEYAVKFKQLTEVQIERYLLLEKPYDCAGSFKSEGTGITLFEKLIGDDPNALVGLPIIRLCEMLAVAGITLP